MSMMDIFSRYVKSCETKLMVYCILTISCAFLDFIQFLIQFIRFGRYGSEHSNLMMIAITLIFLAVDFYYILWVVQANIKFPKNMSENLTRALFGFASDMIEQMKHKAFIFENELREKVMRKPSAQSMPQP